MSSLHFSLEDESDDQTESENSFSNLSIQLETMATAATKDFNTILSEFPDINLLYTQVNTALDSLLRQKNPTEAGIQFIKQAVKKLATNISALKIPISDPESLSEILNSTKGPIESEDVKAMKDELNKLYTIRDQLLSANKQQRKKFEDEMDRMAIIHADLTQSHQSLSTQLKIQQDSNARLQQQINELTADQSNLYAQIKELQEKYDKKSTKLDDAKDEIEKLKASLKDAEYDLTQAELSKSTLDLDKTIDQPKNALSLQQENKRLQETVAQLNKISDEQTNQILKMIQAKKDTELENAKLEEKLARFEDEKTELNAQIAKLTKRTEEQKKDNDFLIDQNNKLQDKFNQTDTALTQLQMVCHKITDAANQVKKTELNDVDQLINDLAARKSDEEMMEENERLRALVDTLARFFDSAHTGNTVSGVSILDKNLPLMQDDDVRSELERRINNIKVTIQADKEHVDTYEQLFGNELLAESTIQKIKSRNSPDEYAAVVALSSINEQLRNQFQEKTKLLESLRRLLPSEYANQEICQAIVGYFTQLDKLIGDLTITANSILQYKYNQEDNKLNILSNYINESASIFTQILNQLRPITSFYGTIADLPHFLKEFLDNIMNDIKKTREEAEERELSLSKSLQNYQNNQETTEDMVKLVTSQFQDRLALANEQIKKHQSEIEHLKEKLDLENDEKHTMETKLSALNQETSEVDAQNTSIKNENLRLRNLLRERAETFQKQLEEALKAQQQQHDEALKRMETKYNEKLAALESQLQVKSKKLEKVRKQGKETQELLQKSIDAQRDSMKLLLQQNAELSQRLANSTDQTVLVQKVKDLEAKLQEANSSKYQLVLQMNKQNTTQTAKQDQELIKQISDKLVNSGSCKVPENGWTSKSILHEIGQLAEKYRISKLSTSGVTRVKNMTETINQWNQWSQTMAKQIDNNIDPEQMDANSIRSLIGDCVKTNTQKARTIEIMQSLRAQKAMFKAGVSLQPSEKDRQAEKKVGSISALVLFLSIIKHKAQVNRAREMIEEVTSAK